MSTPSAGRENCSCVETAVDSHEGHEHCARRAFLHRRPSARPLEHTACLRQVCQRRRSGARTRPPCLAPGVAVNHCILRGDRRLEHVPSETMYSQARVPSETIRPEQPQARVQPARQKMSQALLRWCTRRAGLALQLPKHRKQGKQGK
eukprot:Rmarinus@m.25080